MPFEIFPWVAMRRHKGERNIAEALRDIKDCNFTASCFIEAKDIALCREIGLDPIVYPFRSAKPDELHDSDFAIDTYFKSSDGRPSISPLVREKGATAEQIDAAVKDALTEMPEGKLKLYVVDEPGASAFERIRVMVDSAKKYRPDLTYHICLFPNYAMCGKPDMSQLECDTYDEYLDRYCALLGKDVPLCVDNYDIIIGMDNQKDGHLKRYLLNLVQCREACDKHGVELHYIVNSNQLRTFTTIPTMSNLMLQAFTVIAAGSRALSWFTYFGRGYYCYAPVNDNGDKDIRTPVWYMLKEVNRRALSMGNHLYDMEFKGIYFSDTMGISRAKHISECPEIKSFSSDLPCMIGMYEDKGEPVAIVVNTSLEHSTRMDISFGDEEILTYSTECEEYTPPLVTVGRRLPGADGCLAPIWLAPGDAVIVRSKK